MNFHLNLGDHLILNKQISYAITEINVQEGTLLLYVLKVLGAPYHYHYYYGENYLFPHYTYFSSQYQITYMRIEEILKKFKDITYIFGVDSSISQKSVLHRRLFLIKRNNLVQ